MPKWPHQQLSVPRPRLPRPTPHLSSSTRHRRPAPVNHQRPSTSASVEMNPVMDLTHVISVGGQCMASAGLESGPRGSVSHADAMPAPARSTMTKLFRLLICSLQENASVATQKRLPNGQSSLKWRCSHTHTGWPFVCFQIRFVHEGRHLAIAVSGDDLYITAVSRAVDAATDGEVRRVSVFC